jgi:hypothetical protein
MASDLPAKSLRLDLVNTLCNTTGVAWTGWLAGMRLALPAHVSYEVLLRSDTSFTYLSYVWFGPVSIIHGNQENGWLRYQAEPDTTEPFIACRTSLSAKSTARCRILGNRARHEPMALCTRFASGQVQPFRGTSNFCRPMKPNTKANPGSDRLILQLRGPS